MESYVVSIKRGASLPEGQTLAQAFKALVDVDVQEVLPTGRRMVVGVKPSEDVKEIKRLANKNGFRFEELALGTVNV